MTELYRRKLRRDAMMMLENAARAERCNSAGDAQHWRAQAARWLRLEAAA